VGELLAHLGDFLFLFAVGIISRMASQMPFRQNR
jgi:hypothetical protein